MDGRAGSWTKAAAGNEEQVGKRLIKLEDKNECFADRTHEGTPRGTN